MINDFLQLLSSVNYYFVFMLLIFISFAKVILKHSVKRKVTRQVWAIIVDNFIYIVLFVAAIFAMILISLDTVGIRFNGNIFNSVYLSLCTSMICYKMFWYKVERYYLGSPLELK